MSRDIGIDLGTANTLVYMKGKGIILREPSVVAVDTNTDTVKYVGNEAKEIIGRAPGSIIAIRPLKDGTIADFDIAASMLQLFIKKALGSIFFSRPRVVICIPACVTAVEKRAVREAAMKAGAKRVSIMEEPLAAAIGANLPVRECTGSMIVDIGGGTSEVAVLSLGGCVTSQSVRVAGNHLDNDIIRYVKKKYSLLIGERTAESVKIAIGSAYPYDGEESIEIKGRDLMDAFPRTIMLSPAEVREAMSDSIAAILEAIRSTLERTPPELSADIIDQGVTLSGGGALLRGLDKRIELETGMPVRVADDALDCVVLGAGRILDNIGKGKNNLGDDIRRYF